MKKPEGIPEIKWVWDEKNPGFHCFHIDGIGRKTQIEMWDMLKSGKFDVRKYWMDEKVYAQLKFLIEFRTDWEYGIVELKKKSIDQRIKDLHDPNKQLVMSPADKEAEIRRKIVLKEVVKKFI